MKLGEVIKLLSRGDEPIVESVIEGDPQMEVTGAYVSDLLSDVMANAGEGQIWITLQVHVNIVAVATLKNLPAIIITNSRKPDEETIKKAIEEKIGIFKTHLSTFEIAGRLYRVLKGV